MYVLPCTNDPAQVFTTQLGETKLVVDLQWNDRMELFTLSLANDDTGEIYVHGQAVVLGVDILEPYNLGLGSIVAVDLTKKHEEPNLTNLGNTCNLYWLSEEEVQDVILQTV